MTDTSEQAGDAPAEAGLALLLGGGVAQAMGVVAATLATVQGAAARVLRGLSRVQALGAAAASVPPVARQVRASDAPIAASVPVAAQDRAAPPLAAATVAADTPPLAPIAGTTREATAPAPVPLPLAAQAATAAVPAAPMPAFPPVAAAAPEATQAAAPVLLASFAAPPASVAQAAPLAALGDDGTTPGAPWDAASPDPPHGGWAAPVAPVVANDRGGSVERARGPSDRGAERGGPIGGDVFLDGVRVGTWLADHLAREAGRPQSGATGFDPRLTPAWPGTLQGG